MLRQLEALLIVADPKHTFLLSGTGDVIDPDEGIATIGSGGALRWLGAGADGEYAICRRVEIAVKSLKIAGQILYLHESTR